MYAPDLLSSVEEESALDSSSKFPFNLSIKDVEENVSRTIVLAALSGEKTKMDRIDVEARVEAILAADRVLNIECSQEC